MQKLIIFFIFISNSSVCFAGIENELLLGQYNNCTVRITHDATPDSKTGTIIFRSYTVKDGIHYPCDINEISTSNSLNKAFQQYLLNSGLKPVTSIMLGRLIRYPWARDFLDKNPVPKVTHQEFNKIIFNSSFIEPFANALQGTGYNVANINCEKVLYNDENLVMDALCWLVLEN